MRAELKPYPSYLHLESEWIGAIPSGWDVLPFKRLCKRVDVGIAEAATHAYAEIGVPIVRGTNIRPHRIEGEIFYIEPWFAEKNRSKFMRTGDLVTVRTGYPGVTAVIPPELDKSQCFTMIISTMKKGHLPAFFCYFFNSICGMAHFAVEGWGSAQTNISVPTVQCIKVPYPPLEQQKAIVAFLDHETAKIDRLMEVRRKQVERLHEQRTAVIYHAVTRGLDSSSKLAHSGCRWLGNIPSHWHVQPLWTVARMAVSNVDKHTKEWEQPVQLCNYVDVYKNERINRNLEFMEATASPVEIQKFGLKKGDVIITKDSEDSNDIAVPSIVEEQCEHLVCGYHLAILRAKSSIIPEYLFRLFQTVYLRSYFATRAQGVTRFGLSQNAITRSFIPLPPLEEQTVIVAHIDRETAKLDTLSAKYSRELDLLAEYRASLISHAITGKIDVRDLVPILVPEQT